MTLDQTPPRSNDVLSRATDTLREMSIPSGPPLDDLRRVEQIATGRRARRIGTFAIKRLAACVAFLCVGLIVWFVNRSPGLVFADVVHAVNQSQTFTATLETGVPNVELHIMVKGKAIRVESPLFTVVANLASGEMLHLIPLTHQAMTRQVSTFEGQECDIYSMLRDYQSGAEKPAGEKVIKGRKTQGFELTRDELTWTFWIDKESKLPVRIDIRGGERTMAMTDVQFDVKLDDTLFEIKPPQGYTLANSTDTWDRAHYAGHVTDERGKPLANVTVRATIRHVDGGGSSFGDEITTDQTGRFTIDADADGFTIDMFGKAKMFNVVRDGAPVRLEFRHPDMLYGRIDDVHLLSPEQRSDFHIRLRDGKTIAGKVLDTAGHPIAGATVQTVFGKDEQRDHDLQDAYRKFALTDTDGKFELRGLPSALAKVQVRKTDTPGPMLCGHCSIDLQSAGKSKAAEIVAKPFDAPAGKVHELFGMKLLDVDRELREQLDPYHSDCLMILDPGPNAAKLHIGDLRRGDAFWRVDQTRVIDFNSFAKALLTACEAQQRAGKTSFSIRVVFNFCDGSDRSPTQIMSLSANDLAELRAAAGDHK